MAQNNLRNTLGSSDVQKTNMGLGRGTEFPEENAKHVKSDKVNAAVETLSSVIPQVYASPEDMKNSMFAAADEMNAKFSGLSQVLGSVWSGATGEQTEAIKVSDLLADSWICFEPLIFGAAVAMRWMREEWHRCRKLRPRQLVRRLTGLGRASLFAQTAAQ